MEGQKDGVLFSQYKDNTPAKQGQIQIRHMQNYDLEAMNTRIQADSGLIQQILTETGKVIVGQRALLEGLIIGLLCNGHILLEGGTWAGKDNRRERASTNC